MTLLRLSKNAVSNTIPYGQKDKGGTKEQFHALLEARDTLFKAPIFTGSIYCTQEDLDEYLAADAADRELYNAFEKHDDYFN